MALIECYECDKEISDKAEACPHCGAPKEGQAMATVKRLVCLANSRKLSGRCIAGIEVDRAHQRPGRHGGQHLGWIRPVSAREHEEVSEHERQYKDGSDPRVLDVIDVPLLDPVPKSYQQENWLLDMV